LTEIAYWLTRQELRGIHPFAANLFDNQGLQQLRTLGRLFYLAAVPVLLVPGLTIQDSLAWDVASDGNRFLLKETASEGSRSPFTVVLNWTALLKK